MDVIFCDIFPQTVDVYSMSCMKATAGLDACYAAVQFEAVAFVALSVPDLFTYILSVIALLVPAGVSQLLVTLQND
jgi:hypothetical protein